MMMDCHRREGIPAGIQTAMIEEKKVPEMRRRRAIYLLPNLFTTSALFAGFYAIIVAMGGQFSNAAVAVFTAMILDTLDGRVARLTKTSSDFGAQYDSLSDVISFGVAPALIVYEWSLQYLSNSALGHLGLFGAFLYTACTALRLARFNTMLSISDKRFFQGLPCPAAAAIVVGMVWVVDDLGYRGAELSLLALIVTMCAALVMVSPFSYYSFKDIGTYKRLPFMALIAIVVMIAFTAIDPPKFVYAGFFVYMLSGPAFSLWRKLRKREARTRH